MCIISLAWQLIPDQPLLLLANRDEFYARPTTPLQRWAEQPILAGRDQQSGGTWLGMTPSGRWAALTNFRQVPSHKPAADVLRSRGLLVSEYLASVLSPLEFARQIELLRYEGFSLLLGTREQAVVVSNRGIAPTVLAAGLYVLSNALIDEPWPKVERLRQRVTQEVLPLFRSESRTELSAGQDWQAAAFEVLADTRSAEDVQLPQTGIGLEMERLLSSVFIASPIYGTRCSTVLAFDDQGYMLSEQTHATGTGRVNEVGSW
ncbi:MAG: NRDE family protein [Moraxellaceae bacterium]